MSEPLTLHELITSVAGHAPESVAFLAPGKQPLTYARLAELLGRVRRTLRNQGIGRTARVAIALPVGPEAAAAFLSVSACATSVPLQVESDTTAWADYFPSVGAGALLTQAGFRPEIAQAARRLGMPVLEVCERPTEEAGWIELSASESTSCAEAAVDLPRAEDTALVLGTSGSTGQPKYVRLTHGGLCLSSIRTARSLELGPDDRCLNMLPLQHVHGLISAILVPMAASGSVALTSGFDADRVLGWLESLRPTWIPAPPALLQALLERAQSVPGRRYPELRFVRSGSTPLWPALVDGLEQTFGVPVIEAYGMTEAPHITGNPLVRRRRGSVGRAIVDDLVIMDETGQRLPPGTPGEIVVRGSTLTPGYLNVPESSASGFRDGWFRTGDLGWLDAEGYLFLAGRLKEMINRGGQKVIPREVDDVLLSHPTIREAAAFAVAHPTLGEDLAAAVVLRNGFAPAEQELRQFLAQRLPGFKVPSRILFLARLPREAGGKIRRTQLAETLAAELAVPREPPVGADELRAAAVFEEVLGSRVGRNDNFFSLGGDSLRATQVVARLGAALELTIGPTVVFEHPTVALLAAELARRVATMEDSQNAAGSLRPVRIARQPRVPHREPMPVKSQ